MEKKQSLIKAIAFTAIGVLSIVFAFICIDGMYNSYSNDYDYEYSIYEFYGGDAYTGIQHAAVNAANNAREAGKHISATINGQGYLVQKCFGYVLLIACLLLVVTGDDGIIGFFKELREEKQKEAEEQLTII